MSIKETVSVFGAGAFGTSLAQAFARNGSHVRMWARSPHIVDEINHHRRNLKYAGQTPLHQNIIATTDFESCLTSSNIWVYACPSSFFKRFLCDAHNYCKKEGTKNRPLLNSCKGLEPSSLNFYHTVAQEILGEDFVNLDYACLSGPSFAAEILHEVPTCVTISSLNQELLVHIQRQLSSPTLRMFSNNDLIGTQLGGAMKNVLAIASGAIEGMGLGYNTQAAFINLGLGEMARLGKALGARIETFLGFSGVGDLILTCTSPLSRNRTFGQLLGKGHSVEDAFKMTGSTIEGYVAAKVIYELSVKYSVRAPICEQVFETLHNGRPLKAAIEELLSHPPRAEWS